YSFACVNHGKPTACMLGRVPIETADQRTAWTFWDGKGWSSDINKASALFDAAPIIEVSKAPALGGWLAIYAKPFSNDIAARFASELTGPWSDELVLWTVDEKNAPYDVVQHAELAEQDGAVQVLSYSHSTTGWFGSEHVALKVTLTKR